MPQNYNMVLKYANLYAKKYRGSAVRIVEGSDVGTQTYKLLELYVKL